MDMRRRIAARGRRGQALVLLGLAFAGFLALVALAIDGGNAFVQRRRAQNAADAAALSGARRLWEIRRQGGSEADLLAALRERPSTPTAPSTWTAPPMSSKLTM